MLKKTIIATAAIASLTACTATPEMVEGQKSKCAQIGYAPGSPAYLACVERGVQGIEGGQTAFAVEASTALIALGAADLLF